LRQNSSHDLYYQIGFAFLGVLIVAWGLRTIYTKELNVQFKSMRRLVTLLTKSWAVSTGMSLVIGGLLFIIGGLQQEYSLLPIFGLVIPFGVSIFCIIMQGAIEWGKYLGGYPDKPKRKEKPKNDQKPKRGE